MSVTDCAKCLRLWRDYAQATQYELSLWEQMPPLGKELDKVQALERKIHAAAAARELAWEVIQSHEASEHARKPPDPRRSASDA
jgi:hypothetical protein